MPELIYYVAASLDGFIATPSGGVEWLSGFEQSGEDYGYREFYATIDTLVMGRNTYDEVRSYGAWPYAGKPAWVCTESVVADPTPDVRVTHLTPHALMRALEAGGAARCWLVGGGRLAAAFHANGLITEYVVSVIPVILGDGIPMLATNGEAQPLHLEESVAYPTGVVQLRYRTM